jgi:hypothetical protein
MDDDDVVPTAHFFYKIKLASFRELPLYADLKNPIFRDYLRFTVYRYFLIFCVPHIILIHSRIINIQSFHQEPSSPLID